MIKKERRKQRSIRLLDWEWELFKKLKLIKLIKEILKEEYGKIHKQNN